MTDREKAIVMAYTGYTMLAGDKLDIFYHYVQEKLGRCVMTHELSYEEVQDAIRGAAKEDFIALAKPDNGWISVKDRLPDSEEQVLIVYEWVGRSGGKYREIAFDSFKAMRFLGHKPLFWMPLPEPTDEEDD